jgi:hypothetical protein
MSDLADGEWVSPHDPGLHLPLECVRVPSALGVPVVAPEIVLLLKAPNRRRAALQNKDEHDFQRALPNLRATQRAWLRAQLERLRPGDPWIPALGTDLPS